MTMTMMTLAQAQTFWKPEQASTVAAEVDWLFYFILYLSTFMTVLVAGLMVYFAIRFRRKDPNDAPQGMTHSTALEITWSVIPTVILLFIFVVGFKGYLDMIQPPSNAFEVKVNSWKWAWEFEYPNGAKSQFLHVPADRPVILTLTSNDVIHSLYVPAFRIKKDCVPGRYNKAWFQTQLPDDRFSDGPKSVTSPTNGVTETFENVAVFDLFCTEYCGTKHSEMRSFVIVHKREGFKKWMVDAANQFEGLTPVEMGEILYKQRQCISCHSIDGSQAIGPSFKDLYGKSEQFSNAPPIDVVDENYLRESIVNPNAKIVLGYAAGQMPSYANLPDQELDALVAYIKSLSKNYDPMAGLEDGADAPEPATDGEDVLQDEQDPKAPGGMEAPREPETEEQKEAEGALQGPE